MKMKLLNYDYTPIGVVSWKRGIKLVLKDKVDVMVNSDIKINDIFYLPTVIKLKKYINFFNRKKVHYSRKIIYVRDKYTCGYCGKKCNKHELTIDHILPISKGGKTTFQNCMTCCKKCNLEKGNKDISQYNHKIKHRLYTPTMQQYIHNLFELGEYE